MDIPDRWIADMQLVEQVIHMELHPVASAPHIGTVLITEHYGTWQTLAVIQVATPVRGTVVAVKLIQSVHVQPGPR